jgi:hypothetical protein
LENYELLREMMEMGIKPTHFTYNFIYGCLSTRKVVSGGCDMLKKMGAWIKHTTILMKELLDHWRVIEACEVLDNMV